MHTGLVTTARRIWLTPATAVLAAAILAAVMAASAVVWWRVLGKLPTGPAAATAPSPGPAYTVSGKVRVSAGQYVRDGQGCRRPDAQVVVTDSSGASLAYAPLQPGQLAAAGCELPFTLTIPAGHGSYGVDVPTVGRLDYTEAQLRDLAELTIG